MANKVKFVFIINDEDKNIIVSRICVIKFIEFLKKFLTLIICSWKIEINSLFLILSKDSKSNLINVFASDFRIWKDKFAIVFSKNFTESISIKNFVKSKITIKTAIDVKFLSMESNSKNLFKFFTKKFSAVDVTFVSFSKSGNNETMEKILRNPPIRVREMNKRITLLLGKKSL